MDKARLVRVSKGVVVYGAVASGLAYAVATITDPENKKKQAIVGLVLGALIGSVFQWKEDYLIIKYTKK